MRTKENYINRRLIGKITLLLKSMVVIIKFRNVRSETSGFVRELF